MKKLTAQELIEEYGAVLAVAEDERGITRAGYWIPGDGDGEGFGTYLGGDEASATEAIVG